MKDDTIFRIYSMTKPITSVAFMMLFEEGRVALDEPVHKYIPEWKDLGVFVAGTAPAFLTRPPSRPMLIVDLVATHLRPDLRLPAALQRRRRLPREEDRRSREGGNAAIDDRGPGEKFRWNSRPARPGTIPSPPNVIGYLVGKISGMPFEQFLKQRIFDPLGMNDTDFFVPRQGASFAACYSADPKRRHDLPRRAAARRLDAAG